MARIARDSTPKRRSARLSSQQSAKKTATSSVQLDAVLERDETPEIQTSIDEVVATPSTNLKDRFKALSNVTTPKTEPKPGQEQMHPATVHQTTAKAPDSGLKLGFADIATTGNASLASMQNTPSRPRQSLARTNIPPSFQFHFNREPNMSEEGRKLIEAVRGDAARIKEQMRAQREIHGEKDADAEGMHTDAAGRKIAKPTARSGRFSEVHMAQFKKMDSIANHPSSFRARPGFARPPAHSLKRTSSKANLDEPERPRTAGKSPSTRIPPPITGRPASLSPFKSIPHLSASAEAPAKRMRRQGDEDVSSSRPVSNQQSISSRLLSPTKASAARTATSTNSPAKQSAIPRSNSVRSIKSVSRPSAAAPASPSKLPQAQLNKPLPPTPRQSSTRPEAAKPVEVISPAKEASPSRIPTAFANLKSILRSPKKTATSSTPRQPIAGIPIPVSSQKKVDFTPSVKSRYAVKLAEGSPSPAKVDRTNRASDKWEPAIPYDSSAFVVDDKSGDWGSDNDGESRPVYPNLPSLSPRPESRAGPVDYTFARHAQEHNRRESQQFKSIFTKCNPGVAKATSLTSVNTSVNRTNPVTNAARVASTVRAASSSPRKSTTSPTIRRVRASEQTSAALVQPFEDLPIPANPHGLPAKKRRLEPDHANTQRQDDGKENQPARSSIPGAWRDSIVPESDDEGAKRGGKRARYAPQQSDAKEVHASVSPIKKPSAAREAAAKSAKDRKAKASIGGKLTASRLNALAQPKQR